MLADFVFILYRYITFRYIIPYILLLVKFWGAFQAADRSAFQKIKASQSAALCEAFTVAAAF